MALNAQGFDPQQLLNDMTPGSRQAKLGDCIYNLINGYNALATKYNELLAHLDTANVTGIGNANAATYGEIAELPLPEDLPSR